MKQADHKKPHTERSVQQQINRRTFISFAAFFAAGGAIAGGWKWLYNAPEETAGITGGARRPLRRALNSSELFFRRIFSNDHPVKTYSADRAARNVRVNGDIGINDEGYNPEKWQLVMLQGERRLLQIDMAAIKALPKSEIVFDFKCVEGWDQIQHWGGVKFTDLIQHFKLEGFTKMKYVGMATPNNEYYVGLDMESALHPQTILAYEMNGQPLLPEHGAPLRLIIPVKYGIKHLKRIGTITFSQQRPPDYWAEQGYDYYSGL
jgi:hypothetical protein